MKYNNTIQMLKTAVDTLKEPTIISDKIGINKNFTFLNDNILNNNVYTEDENTNIENNEVVPIETSKSYTDNSNIDRQQDASSAPQGVIDSIAQELTSARLKQAIILSEIVGKPRSKTRRKRRF